MCNCQIVRYPLFNFTMNHQTCFAQQPNYLYICVCICILIYILICIHTYIQVIQTLSSANTSSWPTTLAIFWPPPRAPFKITVSVGVGGGFTVTISIPQMTTNVCSWDFCLFLNLLQKRVLIFCPIYGVVCLFVGAVGF